MCVCVCVCVCVYVCVVCSFRMRLIFCVVFGVLLSGLRCEDDEPWDEDDFYTLLGVSQDASLAVIKRAYRKMSLEFHPDSAGEAGKEMFQKLSRAYEILSNANLRRAYDHEGLEGVEAFEKQQSVGEQRMNDPFAAFFGGGGPKKRPSLRIPLFISLKDLYLGKTIEASMFKQTRCKKCRGTGARTKKDLHKCSHCKGTGVVVGVHQIAPGMYQQVRQQCPHCEGKGKVIGRVCNHCAGKKIVSGMEHMSIDIEKGTLEGHVVSFSNMCDEIAGSSEAPGDVLFEVHALPGNVTRDGNKDLRLTVEISLVEALVGFTKEFEHLDNTVWPLDRADKVTPHGHTDKIKNGGMPVFGKVDEYGDLIVTYKVVFPTTLTEQQRDAIREIIPM